jgi:hypothetical protein
MAPRNLVISSIETDDGGRCVDIFERPDGSFGFDEYRRDAEDGRGWFPVGFHAERRFATEIEARTAAHATVAWLHDSQSKP